jgi:hypothetical protein
MIKPSQPPARLLQDTHIQSSTRAQAACVLCICCVLLLLCVFVRVRVCVVVFVFVCCCVVCMQQQKKYSRTIFVFSCMVQARRRRRGTATQQQLSKQDAHARTMQAGILDRVPYIMYICIYVHFTSITCVVRQKLLRNNGTTNTKPNRKHIHQQLNRSVVLAGCFVL